MGGFHSQAGWIAFNAVALGLVALTMQRGYFRREPIVRATGPTTSEHDPTAAYLAPFAAITATAMMTGAFSAGFDWLVPAACVRGDRRPLDVPSHLRAAQMDVFVAGDGHRCLHVRGLDCAHALTAGGKGRRLARRAQLGSRALGGRVDGDADSSAT
jgi:hypothetical protein